MPSFVIEDAVPEEPEEGGVFEPEGGAEEVPPQPASPSGNRRMAVRRRQNPGFLGMREGSVWAFIAALAPRSALHQNAMFSA